MRGHDRFQGKVASVDKNQYFFRKWDLKYFLFNNFFGKNNIFWNNHEKWFLAWPFLRERGIGCQKNINKKIFKNYASMDKQKRIGDKRKLLLQFVSFKFLFWIRILLVLPTLLLIHRSIVFTDCVPKRRRVLCLVWSFWLNPIFMFYYISKTIHLILMNDGSKNSFSP